MIMPLEIPLSCIEPAPPAGEERMLELAQLLVAGVDLGPIDVMVTARGRHVVCRCVNGKHRLELARRIKSQTHISAYVVGYE
jgi:hypothetical protein